MITKIINVPTAMFETVRKAFSLEHLSYIPHSLGLAYVIQEYTMTYVQPKIQVVQILLKIFSEEVIKNIILTLFIFVVGMGMYLVVFVFDFITGLKASRKEHFISSGLAKGYVRSDKLWSSVWKFFAVIVISAILTVFSTALALIDQSSLHQGGMLITLFFYLMVISFDIFSIGENQERMFGKKPAFFNRMDWFTRKIGDLMMLRIFKVFTGSDYGNSNYPQYPDENNKEEDTRKQDEVD